MTFEEELTKVTKEQFIYYKKILDKTIIINDKFNKKKSIKFCEKAISEDMSIDKLSRWLGFIQGILFMNNLIDLDKERERTRPLFQEVYIKHKVFQKTISI